MADAHEILTTSLLLVVAGVSLQFALRLLYGARGPAAGDTIYLLSRSLSWVMIVLPLAVLAVAATHWLAVLLLLFGLNVLAEMNFARRQLHRRAAWECVCAAASGPTNVLDALRIHLDRFTGGVGRAYRRLVRDLEQGAPWRAAVADNSRAFPPAARAYLCALDDPQQRWPQRLSEVGGRDDELAETWRQIGQRSGYLIGISLVLAAAAAFIGWQIVPQLRFIMSDFGMESPNWIVDLEGFARFAGAAAIPLAAILFLGAAAAVAIGHFHLMGVPVLQTWTDRLFAARHRSEVLRVLALAVDERLPLGEAIERLTAADWGYPARFVRLKLQRAGQQIANGIAWQDALHRQNLVSQSDVAVLRAAQAAGNLPWAMRAAADQQVRRMALRLSLVQNIVFTVVLLVLGCLVLVIAVSVMLPLASLVAKMST